MVKLTIVGRVNDGLPLAQEARYMNNGNHNFSSNYKQQAEFLLKEISRGAFTTFQNDRPRLSPFFQDLQKEFDKFDHSLIEKITRPYSFIRFDSIIANIRKQYIDTRTQANLSKLNANRRQELDIITENMSDIIERRRNSEILETPANTPQTSSPVWGSARLEAIALIWMPITIIAVVATVLLWVRLVFTDDFLISTL